jgi:hypothetical protein
MPFDPLNLWKIFWYSLSKFVRWMKPEPLTVTVRQWVVFGVLLVVFAVLTAAVSFYGGWKSFEYSADEKLKVQEVAAKVQEGAAAEARAKRDDQEKQLVQEREEREMKDAQERQERQKQLAQIQKEILVQVFATPTPPDPADVARYQAKANLWSHFVYEQRESQRYDKPPGADDTVWEQQTYTDSHGLIWQRETSTDSDGVKRDYFEPQMPKEIH